MIGLRSKFAKEDEVVKLKGYDDFDVTLGDVLRGERATQGKSLDDLKRELRIQPSYLLAIEESDPTAFDTPGFIAGYVRSYAGYLGLDPDWAFSKFCEESGFATAHGMSEEAKPRRRDDEMVVASGGGASDPFMNSAAPFIPPTESFMERVNVKALGSMLVLLLLVGGLGYGAMNVVQQIQTVQVVPIDQPPAVEADLDPLVSTVATLDANPIDPSVIGTPRVGSLDRLYRPQSLQEPIFEPRDGPIANLDPAERGIFGDRVASPALPNVDVASAEEVPQEGPEAGFSQLTEAPVHEVVMFAVREVWARAVAPDGTRVFQGILQPGQQFVVPQTEEPVRLRAGNRGSLYFLIDGEVYGPAGRGTGIAKRVSMDKKDLIEKYNQVSGDLDPALVTVMDKWKNPDLPSEDAALVENQN